MTKCKYEYMITCFIDTVIYIHRIYIWLIHFPITKDMFLLYDKYQYVYGRLFNNCFRNK